MFDFASYHRAATLADAINLLADNPQAKLLADGTDVLIQLHHHNDRYRHIVDIHNLAELRGVTSLPTVEIFATVPPAQILPRQR